MSSGLTVDISRAADGWDPALPEADAVIRRAAESAWESARARGESEQAEVSIMLADDALVRKLNRDYRGKDRPTNVLSFPAEDSGAPGRARLLGDVVLALETVRREAADRSKPLSDHVSHLVVHGMLHLLGRDHETETQAAAMEALEIEILAGLGVDNPYLVVEDAADRA